MQFWCRMGIMYEHKQLASCLHWNGASNVTAYSAYVYGITHNEHCPKDLAPSCTKLVSSDWILFLPNCSQCSVVTYNFRHLSTAHLFALLVCIHAWLVLRLCYIFHVLLFVCASAFIMCTLLRVWDTKEQRQRRHKADWTTEKLTDWEWLPGEHLNGWRPSLFY